jgi:hypothetical protein
MNYLFIKSISWENKSYEISQSFEVLKQRFTKEMILLLNDLISFCMD